MARLFFTGAEVGSDLSGASESVGGFGGAISYSSTNPRTGTYCFLCNPVGAGLAQAWFGKLSASGSRTSINTATVYARGYARFEAFPASASEEICSVSDTAGGIKCTVRIDSNGKLNLYTTDGTTLLAGPTVSAMPLNTYTRIEVKAGTGASAVAEVRVNGAVVLSATHSSTNNVQYFKLGKEANRNSQGYTIRWDDIATDDAAYPGPGEIRIALPNGAGTDVAWSGAYTLVDEVPPDLGDFAQVIGDGSTYDITYAMQDAATVAGTGSINSVIAWSFFSVGIGAPRNCATRVRQSSSTQNTTGFSVSGSTVGLAILLNTAPATSAAWTNADFDALQIGARESEGAGVFKLGAVYAMVEFTSPEPPAGAGNSTSRRRYPDEVADRLQRRGRRPAA